jgi:hypothetical protein
MDLAAALKILYPNATWSIERDYASLVWPNQMDEKPSEEVLVAEATRLQAEWVRTEYQRKRAKEYPDPRVYLDAIVKGDTAQMQQYVDACLAVKAKYPKPE